VISHFDEIDPSSEAWTPCVPPAAEPSAPGGAKITPRDFELCKVQEKSHVFFAESH